jgi:uncharacterized protein YhjY with autotransporter beta-barrel domain
MQRVAARFSSFVRRPHAWLLIVALSAVLPHAAHATCTTMSVPDAYTTPSTSPMASGGSISINAGTRCDDFGLNPYPSTGTTNPAHGSVSVDAAAGIITYTNNGDGATSDSFVIADASANLFTVNVAIGAATSPITVSPASLPTPNVGTAYSQTLSATGGTGPYGYVLSSGALPPGLSLSGATISGTPTQAGSYSSTLTVTDNVGTTATKSYSLTVPNPSSGITVAAPTTANLNAPYSYNLNTNTTGALAPYTYSALTSGSLPAGLSLSGGVISGTPTATGTSNFSLTVTDSSPNLGGVSPGPYFKSVNLSITVQNVPPTAGAVSATVAYGSSSNPITLNITGAPAASVAVGTAPAHGAATATGTSITYTPTAGYAGPDSFTYTATNGAGTSSPATATITVSPPALVYAPANPVAGTDGVAYSQSIAGASGGTAPYTYALVSGALPAGISLSSNGTLSGTATAVGTFAFKVTATDSSTGTGPFSVTTASNVSLTINAPTVAVSPTTLAADTIHTPYSASITAQGGTTPYTFAVTGGALPTGLTLASDGTLSGTPTAIGSFNFTITATDSSTGSGAPFSGSRAYTMLINGATITLSPATLPHATKSSAYSQTFIASGGTAAYSFALTSGSLPAGLTLSSAGTLSGTPTQAGTFSFTVTATDADGSTGSQAYTLVVDAIAPDAPTITGAIAGDGQAQVTFSAPLDDGGAAITGYTATASPGGATGTLSGATGGTITVGALTNGVAYTFTVTATNTVGTSVASAPSASVTPKGAQSITFNNPGTQNFGTAPTLTATASSGLTPTFSSSTTGVCTITGGGALTFISAGTCTIDADQPGDGAYLAAPTVSQSFTVAAVVPGAPVIGVSSAGDTTATVSFSAPSSNGGAAITGYTVTSNPGGITATGATGPITVIGLTNGTAYTFTVTASNSAGTGGASAASNSVTPQATQTITFSNPGAQSFGTTPTLVATASSGLTVTFTSSTTAVCTITTSGVLSTVSPGTCTINADQAGNGAFLAAARVTRSFAIVVPGGAVAIDTTSVPQGTAGSAYSQTIAASGGATPYTFALTAGALPAGVSMTSAGVLSGTPTVAGTFNFIVQVTDAATQTASQALSLVVAAPTISLSPATLLNGIAGTAYSQNLVASGGTAPYTFALSAGALPIGLTLASDGTLSGTSTVSGIFNITVTATDSLGFSGAQAYTLTMTSPAITITPASLPGATVATAYAQTLSASGGTAPYTFAITSGALPAGLTFAGSGALSGTPTAGGTFNITVTATDALGFTASHAYALTVVAPGITIAPATLPAATAGTAYSQSLSASGGTAPYSFAITASALPSGLTLASDGTLSGTPNVSGSFNFSVTATDSSTGGGPYSGVHAYTLVVTAAPPVVVPDNATTLSGVGIDIAVTANDSGRIDSIALASPPSHGSATVNGLLVAYVPVASFSGSDHFTYVATGPGGTSAPAVVTITVHPMPVAMSRSVDAVTAEPVTVDLTQGATGGPFTGATLVTLAPANAGTATIANEGGTWVLHFTSDANFSGDATARFTLQNAYATSAEATITFKVQARPDPSQDAQVRGLLDAQVESARRFAQAQLGNFGQRLEQLHGAGQRDRFTNSVTFAEHTCAQATDRDAYIACQSRREHPQTKANTVGGPYDTDTVMTDGERAGTDASTNPTSGAWVGGMIRSGSFDGRGGSGIGFESDGLSAGVDVDLTHAFTLGAGLGYGRDDNTIAGGSRLKGSARAFVGYASYHPWSHLFLDGMLGYQQLDYDTTRQLTGTDGVVRGNRDGSQWFASLSMGADVQHGALQVTPYARVDLARGSLDGYTETGDPYLALRYEAMDIDSSTGNLGLRLAFRNHTGWGWFEPQLRLEYQRQFDGAESGRVRYADLANGPFYTLAPSGIDRNRLMLGLGATLDSNSGWSTHVEYQTQTGGQRDEGVQLNVQKDF